MKYIQLTQGMKTQVSDEDYHELCKYKWYYKKQGRGGYAARNVSEQNKTRKTIRMHRQIMQTPAGFETDHINGDKLDNRRENLRVVTKNQNQWNRSKQAGTSKYKGIYWNKKNERWHVQLQINGKKVWLGYYTSEDDAHEAYKKGVQKFFGVYGRIA